MFIVVLLVIALPEILVFVPSFVWVWVGISP